MALPPIQNGPIQPATGSVRPAARLPEAFTQRLAALGIETPGVPARAPQAAVAQAAASQAAAPQPAAAPTQPTPIPDRADPLARPGRVLDIRV